jgi:hypothetical protein
MRKYLLTTAGVVVLGYIAVSNGIVTFTADRLTTDAPDLTLTLDCRGAESDNYKKDGNLTHADTLRFYTPTSGKPAVEEILQLYAQRSEAWDKEYERVHSDFRRLQQGLKLADEADPKYWEKWNEMWNKNHYPYASIDTIYDDPVKIYIVSGRVDGHSVWFTPNTIKSVTPGHIDFVEYGTWPTGRKGKEDMEGSIDRGTGMAWFADYGIENNQYAEPPLQRYFLMKCTNAKPTVF